MDKVRVVLEHLCDLKRMKMALESQHGESLELAGGTVLRSDIERYYESNKEAAWQQAFDALAARRLPKKGREG